MASRTLILANLKAGALQLRELLSYWPDRIGALLGDTRRHSEERRRRPGVPASLELLAGTAARFGIAADVEPVPPRERLPEFLLEARSRGYRTIVVAGGDGTVRSVAQFLVGSGMRLGILPMGTSNNFAHSMGIPARLERAMETLAAGEEMLVDAGRVGNEYFLEAAGVGLFADAIALFGEEEPRWYQVSRMLQCCGPLCWRLRTRSLKLCLDGVECVREVAMAVISNSAYMGPGMEMAPDARLTDGMFDIALIRAGSRWDLGRMAASLARNRRLPDAFVERLRARRVEVSRVHRSHQPLPVHADDHIAAYTPAVMEVMPAALRVVAPAGRIK
ncbi:MAG TPA: diacylglycerol kinase family protein [Chthonomonadales bacterium]|nr:diacylglycerol kinase family protein [Chthonomonadales bacterium]